MSALTADMLTTKRTTQFIDARIERVKLILKRLRAERRLVSLRERHRDMLRQEQSGHHLGKETNR